MLCIGLHDKKYPVLKSRKMLHRSPLAKNDCKRYNIPNSPAVFKLPLL